MRSTMISVLAVAATAAPTTPLIDSLVADMKMLDSAVLQFGGQNPRPIMEAYQKLQMNINGIVASIPASPATSHVKASNATGAAEPGMTGGREEYPLAVAGEDLLRDIKSGKWAFQLAGICSKAFEATTKLGTSYEALFVALSTQAPAESQAGIASVGVRVNQAFQATAAVLAPTNCIDGLHPMDHQRDAMAPKPVGSHNATHGTGSVMPSKNTTSTGQASGESGASKKEPGRTLAASKNGAAGLATFSVGGVMALVAAMIL